MYAPGHDDRAWNVAWNPVKPILASCSADKSVRLYHYTSSSTSREESSASSSPTYSFAHLSTIPTGHTKTVRAVAWAPSGKTLATASFDANIGIWEQEADDDAGDVNSGDWECVSLLEGHETECKSVAYSSTGTLLASCSRDKTVWVWEVHPDADFECLGVLMEHTQDVKCVAWHPTEEILASASYDDTVKLYIDDPSDDWYCFATLTGHASTVWSVAWAPSGSYLASASDDRTIRIWRRAGDMLEQWECVLVIEGHERSIYSLSWSARPSGPRRPGHLGWLASTGGDGKIKIWEFWEENASADNRPRSDSRPMLYHALIASLSSAHGVCDVNSVAWCPRAEHSNLLATAGDDGSVRVWHVAPTRPATDA
ncbi:WD40 repeat-like protein [Punctularia strigosozonata HHB-11173 SS5]|uniref:WD40 repeat-like protein n=1 Tax=Punctularia strigosozonata (strain HHB-11173) TaxID=741275 RepID=UPI0004416CDC|nr:WD40 repeat-like protein [Punctularia strigosozonata HHB-11173 SS5]EIN08976.1 WD40 repeat-like protein [Punctularia strigosozonata HHB-11173 SS5]